MKKKALKITLAVFAVLAVLILIFLTYYLIVTSGVHLDKRKLVSLNSSIEIYDNSGNLLDEQSDGKNVIGAAEIPEYTLNAFVAIEDKRFYSHNGVDFKGFMRAAFNNMKSFSFKEGASTISQQLIKNTHLSGEKTIKRKLSEFKLAKQLENEYSKKEILEMYVNTIYFGDGCYGITEAANNYFGVSPSELTVNQSAALAGMIKAPAVYSPRVSPENCNARKNTVLTEMYKQNYISEAEYSADKNTDIVTVEKQEKTDSPYLQLVKEELKNIPEINGFSYNKLKIYTYFDENLQNSLETAVFGTTIGTNKKAMILNKNNKIQAFYSDCADFPRQLGSTIKPIAVYAPAIDMGIIDACTPINDERINYDGFAPSNYKDAYYGYVSAKFALAKSLNSCAVKILNDCGIENCLNYVKKTDIPVESEDAALHLALGATEKGASLAKISGAYGAFINKGVYLTPKTIKKICTEEGETIYTDNARQQRIYSEETAFIINDMLKDSVKIGTARTLSALQIPLSAKTGTVGTENGNTDAYSVSYNGDYIVSCWLGNTDGSLMGNEISGGTIPTQISLNIWKNLLELKGYNPSDTFNSDKVAKIAIDKLSYEENHTVETADENFPERYVLTEYFKKDRIPKAVSLRFSNPKIENGKISINNNGIYIKLCLPYYCEFKLFKEIDGLKFQIYDSYGKSDGTTFSDKFVMPNTRYKYSAIPYVKGKQGIKYGEEFFFEEIKTPPLDLADDDFWNDFLSFGL